MEIFISILHLMILLSYNNTAPSFETIKLQPNTPAPTVVQTLW